MPNTPDFKWIIEPFARQRHDRTCFDCGNSVLNDWLATKVTQYDKKDLARSYMLVQQGSGVVKGYYAISNHTLVYDALPVDQAKGLPQIDVPVVQIGRLAVDRSVAKQRLGEFLLLDALRRAEYLATKIGIQAIEVDAIDDAAKAFYLKYGFVALRDTPRHLFIPIKTVRKLKLPPL